MTEINKEMIESRLLQLKQYLTIVKQQSRVSLDEFEKNILFNMGIIHLLQVSIQIMIDIASHILSRTSHEVPDEAAQLFDFLHRDQLISKDSAEKYEKMVRFRNLIVHFYVDLRLNRVYEIFQENLSDFDDFINDIQKILKKLGSK